jgi:hypothetical protein
MMIDSQAVKNTNGIKRHLCVDTLGLPFFTHCTPANISDDQGLIEMLTVNINYFKSKPSKKDKAEKGQSGFVPVVARWIIKQSNTWMERCKILVKNYAKTLKNTNTKIQLCFLRIALKSLSS